MLTRTGAQAQLTRLAAKDGLPVFTQATFAELKQRLWLPMFDRYASWRCARPCCTTSMPWPSGWMCRKNWSGKHFVPTPTMMPSSTPPWLRKPIIWSRAAVICWCCRRHYKARGSRSSLQRKPCRRGCFPCPLSPSHERSRQPAPNTLTRPSKPLGRASNHVCCHHGPVTEYVATLSVSGSGLE